METIVKINQKLFKRKLIELAKIKRELKLEQIKDRDVAIKALTPKSPTDILDLKSIKDQYGFCARTIYRYRTKGLKFAKGSAKGSVFIVREDFEKFIKRNIYD